MNLWTHVRIRGTVSRKNITVDSVWFVSISMLPLKIVIISSMVLIIPLDRFDNRRIIINPKQPLALRYIPCSIYVVYVGTRGIPMMGTLESDPRDWWHHDRRTTTKRDLCQGVWKSRSMRSERISITRIDPISGRIAPKRQINGPPPLNTRSQLFHSSVITSSYRRDRFIEILKF